MTRDLCITHQSLQDSLVRRVENPVSLSRDEPCPLSDRPIQYRTITTKMWKERAWRAMGAIERLSCRPALIKFLPLSTLEPVLEQSACCHRENARRKHELKIWKKYKLRKLKRTSHAYSMGFEVTNHSRRVSSACEAMLETVQISAFETQLLSTIVCIG
jgi:hypothetical protein